MAINIPNFPLLSFDQANPGLVGAQRGMDMYSQGLKNISELLAAQKAKAMLPYAGQQAAADLQKAQLYNQNYTPDIQSQISQRMAVAQNQQQEAKQTAFKLAHPEFMDLNAFYYDQQAKGGNRNPVAPLSSGNTNPMPDQSTNQQQDNSNTATSSQGNDATTNSQPSSQHYGQYGVPLPNLPTSAYDPLAAKIFGVAPNTTAALNNYYNQIDYNQKAYQSKIASSVQDSIRANNLQQAVSVFNDAMNQSEFKGSGWKGNIPSSNSRETSILSALGHNFSPEQQADQSAAQMLPNAISQIREAIGSGHWSDNDTKQASNLKFYRGMDDDFRNYETNWVNAVSKRAKEQPQFYSMLGNPQSGAQKHQADMLWAAYQDQFPLASDDGKSVLTKNLNKWRLFATPSAVRSIRDTGNYIAPTLMIKNGKLVPIKKDKVNDALKRGYKVY